MQKQIDFTSPGAYKPCRRKQYEVHVSMPEKGTVLINRYEQPELAKTVNNLFVSFDVAKRNLNRVQAMLQAGQAYQVNDATPFAVCGVLGEYYALSFEQLTQRFVFLSGRHPERITQQAIDRRRGQSSVLNWQVARISPQWTAGSYMAAHLPLKYGCNLQTPWGIANAQGVMHGKGDFVVCERMPNGMPNLGSGQIVNGLQFGATYDVRGWEDFLSMSMISRSSNVRLPNVMSGVRHEQRGSF